MRTQPGQIMASKNSFSYRFVKAFKRDKYLFLLFLPIFIWYCVFCYAPLAGIVIAFQDFRPGMGMFGGEWVGLKWFQQFFQSAFAWRLIRNTALLAGYSIIFGFPIPIIFAICISEINNNNVKRVVQTVSYLPHFISTVVIVGMLHNMLSLNGGIVNTIVQFFGGEPQAFLMDKRWFRTVYVASGVWQNFGFNSIIYIAAIVGIDPSLYESAKIDGITKFKEVWYITLPMIASTIIILFILQLGRIMSVGFEKVFLMYSPAVYDTADVLSTYVYRKGIESNSYSFASAVGLFNSVINFAFVYGSNTICRKLTNTSLW